MANYPGDTASRTLPHTGATRDAHKLLLTARQTLPAHSPQRARSLVLSRAAIGA